MDNNWTASTSTNWIFFDSSHRAKTATGTGNQSITIYVEEATGTDSQSEGLITIKTPTGTISKTIKRCIPTVVSEQKYLSAKINGTTYSGVTTSSSIELGPCNGGSSSQGGGNVIDVKDVILYIVQTLNYGTPKTTTTPLAESDYNVTYKVNGTELSVLDANNGKDRDVVVNVKYKNDNSVSGVSVTVRQKGIKTGDGTYDYNIDMIDANSSGYVESSVTYGEISFNENSSNITASSCNSGNFTFSCNGQITYNYGAVTANTKCGSPITIKSSSTDTGNIKNSDITYSIEPQSAGTFNGNVLTYYENKSRQNETITINAKLVQDITKTTSTTFTVPAGNCAPKMYLHASIVNQDDDTEVQYIEMTGNSVVFKCYLTNQENDGEADRITDREIISCIDSMFEEGISTGTPQVINGIYRRNIEFGRIPQIHEETGYSWSYSAICEYAEINPLVKSIRQASKYEHIIPNCDYFIFSYKWTSDDGKDLDSLTRISTKEGRLITSDGGNVSEKCVGFHAQSDGSICKEIKGSSGDTYLIFGGDNMCSGSEYTCVCLKNILNADMQISSDDEIYVDIYANWYSTRSSGNLSIEYSQYSGTGVFNKDIIISANTDCSYSVYNSFVPNKEYCSAVTDSEIISGYNAKAAGSPNNVFVSNNIECIDGAYTHVARLKYDVSGKTTSLTTAHTYTDKGINLKNAQIVFSNSEDIKDRYKYINTITKQVSKDGAEYNFNLDIYILNNIDESEEIYTVNLFNDSEDEIELNVLNENGEVITSSTITKSNFDDKTTYTIENFSCITNFNMRKNNNNTFDVSFNYEALDAENPKEREFKLIFKNLRTTIRGLGENMYIGTQTLAFKQRPTNN